MKQTKIDFIKLLKGYKDGWVAISKNFSRVVIHGKSLKETMERARNLKEKVYYFPAGESYSNFVGLILIHDNTI